MINCVKIHKFHYNFFLDVMVHMTLTDIGSINEVDGVSIIKN